MNRAFQWPTFRVAVAIAGWLLVGNPAGAAPDVCGDLVDDNGIKASDALALLKKAVGLPQELKCPSSIAAVLSFDGYWSPAQLPGNNGSTQIKPVQCRTSEYVARENEVAVFSLSATASPTSSSTDVLYVEPMVSKDGGLFQLYLLSVAAESMVDGTAHASTVITIPLEVGVHYVFQAGLASNSAASISVGSCQGTVQILRPAP
jgi:hypothetical protein